MSKDLSSFDNELFSWVSHSSKRFFKKCLILGTPEWLRRLKMSTLILVTMLNSKDKMKKELKISVCKRLLSLGKGVKEVKITTT